MASKKRKSKKTESNKFSLKKAILLVFLLVIIGVVGYFGKDNFKEVNDAYNQIDNIIETIEQSIDKEVRSNIDLLTLVEDNYTVILWESSDSKYITSEGIVNRPSYLEGDKVVKLKATYKLKFLDSFSQIIYDFMNLNEKTATYTVKVMAKEATDNEKVTLAIESIYLPQDVYASMSLPTSFPLFDDVDITWKSSRHEVLDNTGKIETPSEDTNVTLTASIQCNEVLEEKNYDINVLSSEDKITEISQVFDDESISSTYKTFTSKGITFINGRVMEYENQTSSDDDISDNSKRYIRLRTNDSESSSFVSEIINGMSKFSFSYKFSGSQTSEKSSFKISYSSDLNNWVQLETITIAHNEEFTIYSKELSGDYAIKVEHLSEWSSDTYVDIDDIKVERNITSTDFESFIKLNIPTSTSKYINLPTTTSYGGVVTYKSSDPSILSNDGVVQSLPEDTKTITLSVIVNYLEEDYEFAVEVKVSGTKEVIPVEIYFIDLGKYGTSDCGESIYLKYGSTDILIDAGDSFDASKRAVEEGITQHLDDQVLDYVIATHPDADHIGGMPNVFEKFNVENLIVFDGDHTSNKYKNFKQAYEDENCNVINIYDDIIQKDDKILSFSEEVYIEFIDTGYLNADTSKETNGKSIVFMLYAYDTKMLFTGDADSQSAHPDLESNYQDKVGNIDILKVVHHATSQGTYDEFLKVVDPELAIICNGNYLGNKHAHPHVQTITRLYDYDSNMKVYAVTGGGTKGGELTSSGGYTCSSEDSMTDRNGTLTLIIINNNQYTLTSEYYNDNPIELINTTYYQNYLKLVK